MIPDRPIEPPEVRPCSCVCRCPEEWEDGERHEDGECLTCRFCQQCVCSCECP